MSNDTDKIAGLIQLFNPLLSKRYTNCGTDFVVLECRNCKTLHTFTLDCGLRICPSCTKKRWSKLHKKYFPLVRSRNPQQLSLLTLTIKNVPELNSNIMHTLIKNFSTFRQRRYVKTKVKGGLWCIEIKGTRGNYNIHIHCILEHSFFSRPTMYDIQNLKIPERLKETKNINSKQDLIKYSDKNVGQLVLSALWEEISGDPIIDIRRVKNAKKAMRYVLKYVTKPPDLDTPEDLVEFLFAVYSIPMLKTFGNWYHSVILFFPPLICPVCNTSSWTVIIFSWQQNIIQDINQTRGP